MKSYSKYLIINEQGNVAYFASEENLQKFPENNQQAKK